ncbi:MAG: sigma 54-interacting transcriptional regulator [Nitrospiraceae bacterium]|nr:sigma 54-interacting transcriptional regulator [Nitrospiraceae bacterium]
MGNKPVFLISDDTAFAGLLKENLPPSGYEIDWRRRLPSNLRQPGYGVRPLIIDLGISESIPVLSAFKAYHPEAGIIAVSNGNFRKTEEALKAGASYVVFERGAENLEILKETIRRVCEDISSKEELEALKSLSMPKIIARSAKMKNLLKLADEAAVRTFPGPDRVLVFFGQPGSGRELIARHMHSKSRRAAMPFVTLVDEAGLIPAALAARGGTLFIKEISMLGKDALAEVKTLASKRQLSSAGVNGGNGGCDPEIRAGVKADVRVMCCCFCPEDVLALDGLKYTGLEVPSIEERREDIIPLANFFIEELTAFLKSDGKYLTKSAREALFARQYPGGAAELKRLVQKAYFLCSGRGIRARDLPGERAQGCSFKSFLDDRLRQYLSRMGGLPRSTLYETVMGEVEKGLIELAMNEMKGNKLRAARALGMNRGTFRAKLKNLKIKG